MKHLHARQQTILEYLLEKPDGATAEQLCEVCEVTKTAIKEHLSRLEVLGYLTFKDRKGLVGRPRRFYLLSPQGMEAFPRQYSWLSTALLEEISQSFPAEKLGQLLDSLASKTAEPLLAQLEKLSETDRLKAIVKVMNDLGYRAQLKETNTKKGAIIEATNCVYHSVAKQNPSLCKFDIAFLEKTSALSVKLESCIARTGFVLSVKALRDKTDFRDREDARRSAHSLRGQLIRAYDPLLQTP